MLETAEALLITPGEYRFSVFIDSILSRNEDAGNPRGSAYRHFSEMVGSSERTQVARVRTTKTLTHIGGDLGRAKLHSSITLLTTKVDAA
jgi:hypothetical protein